jgi:molybdate transport system substrate-binding protein
MRSETSPFKLLSTIALRNVLKVITPDIERVTGRPLEIEYGATMQLCERIRSGTRGDIILAVDSAIDALTLEGILQSDIRVDLVGSVIGMAVKLGAPTPDISTVEALKATLLATPSIVYSKQGASGLYFASLLARLGIEDTVCAKATIIPEGLTGEPVARGEAVLAVQQMSELMQVSGINIFAKLPAEVQQTTVFAAGVFKGTKENQAIDAVLALLHTPAVFELFRNQGLDPIQVV